MLLPWLPLMTTPLPDPHRPHIVLSQKYAQNDILVESTAKKEVKIYKLKDAKVGGGGGGGQ